MKMKMSDETMDALFPIGYPTPPDVMFKIIRKLERKTVMAEMQPLLLRLREKWTDELSADIAATLTPHKLQVMEPEAKALFSAWIHQQKDQKYVQWLKDAEADKTAIERQEMLTIPGYNYWASTVVMRSAIKEMGQALEKLTLEPEQKALFDDLLSMLAMFLLRVDWHTRRGIELPQLDPELVELLTIHNEKGNHLHQDKGSFEN
ncbi:hypothetical protein T069G_01225 [Trichoderma breve]|uniref:Uncharacterized protein n=1 Tax=Trichoderma breve TaxID=2034170 RepID=A0A9W9EDI4_9HYPO|nr:hypothetical protein T069G_01225 [Trichoderma breve]KAJ4864695.1 hypothetical protein T069G_01225 [Trichoderma breve]